MAEPLLILSESMHNADMYYATEFLSSDPFIYLRLPGKEFCGCEKGIIIVSQMDYERAKREASVEEIRSALDYGKNIKFEELLLKVLLEEEIENIEVPRYFHLYTAERLRQSGIEVVPMREMRLTKEREMKDEQEIEYMKKAQRACENAMALALTVIKQSEVEVKADRNVLARNGRILTTEELKRYIEHALIDSGCNCDGGAPLVACGKSAADPHFSGSTPLFAGEPIIIDIFPRLKKERYFADMTRTVVRGTPEKEIKEMYEAVLDAQNSALRVVTDGVPCKEVHNCVCDIFEERGYETLRKGGKKGFIHSTGHGVGLDVHENPKVGDGDNSNEKGNENKSVLRAGNVITIEPGLYYPEVGGVRLEDMVLVRKNGCENLTKFEKKLEIL